MVVAKRGCMPSETSPVTHEVESVHILRTGERPAARRQISLDPRGDESTRDGTRYFSGDQQAHDKGDGFLGEAHHSSRINHSPIVSVLRPRLPFKMLAMVAEFESDLIRVRTREGMQVAKAKGRLRKQPKLSIPQQSHLMEVHNAGTHTTAEPAELFNVARSTVYRTIPRQAPSENKS